MRQFTVTVTFRAGAKHWLALSEVATAESASQVKVPNLDTVARGVQLHYGWQEPLGRTNMARGRVRVSDIRQCLNVAIREIQPEPEVW